MVFDVVETPTAEKSSWVIPGSALPQHSWFQSGLLLWMFWFGVLVSASLWLGGWRLFSVASADESGITWIIVGLFCLALTKSLCDIVTLTRETALASQQTRSMAESQDIHEFLTSSRTSLFRGHIAALYTMLERDPSVSQDNLIEIVHTRLLARNRTVELFASVLVTLGLIGTIVGLIGAVGGLNTVLEDVSTNTENLFSGMKTIVSSLGTAFYTTLFGAVFGGVMLRILLSVVDATVMRYIAHLAELTEVHVLPELRQIGRARESMGYYERKVRGR